MSENVILHTEGTVNYDDGCALLFWFILIFFAGCLGAALLFAGYHLGELFRLLFRVCAVPILIGVLIHIGAFLSRKKYSLKVTDTSISFQTKNMFGAGRSTRIPLEAVRCVYANGNILCIATDKQTFNFHHITDAGVFSTRLNTILREHGIEPATDYASFAHANLAELDRMRGRGAVRSGHLSALPAQTFSRVPVTMQSGQPILPQRLTDEQAAGIFRPEPDKKQAEPPFGTVPMPDFTSQDPLFRQPVMSAEPVPQISLYREPDPPATRTQEENFFQQPEQFLPDEQADAFFRQPPPFQEDEQETVNPVHPVINEYASNEEASDDGRKDYF